MLNSSDREKLFHIMDSDGDTELCFAEFVSSIAGKVDQVAVRFLTLDAVSMNVHFL